MQPNNMQWQNNQPNGMRMTPAQQQQAAMMAAAGNGMQNGAGGYNPNPYQPPLMNGGQQMQGQPQIHPNAQMNPQLLAMQQQQYLMRQQQALQQQQQQQQQQQGMMQPSQMNGGGPQNGFQPPANPSFAQPQPPSGLPNRLAYPSRPLSSASQHSQHSGMHGSPMNQPAQALPNMQQPQEIPHRTPSRTGGAASPAGSTASHSTQRMAKASPGFGGGQEFNNHGGGEPPRPGPAQAEGSNRYGQLGIQQQQGNMGGGIGVPPPQGNGSMHFQQPHQQQQHQQQQPNQGSQMAPAPSPTSAGPGQNIGPFGFAISPAYPQFPFDPRYLSFVPMLQSPQGVANLQRQPGVYHDAMRIAELLRSGQIPQPVMQAMMQANQQFKMQQQAHHQSAAPPAHDGHHPGGGGQPQAAQQMVHQYPMQNNAVPGPSDGHVGEAGGSQGGQLHIQTGQRQDGGGVPPSPAVTSAPPGSGPPGTPRFPLEKGPIQDWEKALNPIAALTHISPFPTHIDETVDHTFKGQLPALSDTEIASIREWLDKDIEYGRAYDAQRCGMNRKLADWRAPGTGTSGNAMVPAWWEIDRNVGKRQGGGDGQPLVIVWPVEKEQKRKKIRGKGKIAARFTKTQMKAVATQEERLVPIRLDIEHDQWRLRDTFVWNAADTVVTPEMFAETICEDLGLPSRDFLPKIVLAIRERLKESELSVTSGRSYVDDAGAEGDLGLDEEELEWWRKHRQETLRASKLGKYDPTLFEEELMTEEMIRDSEVMGGLDLRVKIQLDIISGTMNLMDTFEWDLNSPTSPEEFADVYAADLGLNGEFKTAIAHDIREQVHTYLRSLLLVGHPFDGSAVLDAELRSELLPPVVNVIRKDDNAINAFTPFLNQISDADMERIEAERERDRKKKRGTRNRRVAALPDREPQKTNRSRISTGQVNESGLAIPLAAAPHEQIKRPVVAIAGPTRRAAAIAASAQISDMAIDHPEDVYPEIEILQPMVAKSRRGRWASRNSVEATGSSRAATEEQESNARNSKRKDLPKEETLSPAPSIKRRRVDAEWHCANCGLPEAHLPPNMGKNGGNMPDLCPECSQYIAKYHTSRPVHHGPGAPSQPPAQQQQQYPNVGRAQGSEQPPPTLNSARAETSERDVKPVIPSPTPPPVRIITQPQPPQPASRRDSPLPFQDVASPDSSISSLSETMNPRAQARETPAPAPKAPSTTPAPTAPPMASPSKPLVAPAVARKVSNNQPPAPDWLQTLVANAHTAHPGERYELIYKGKPPGGGDEASAWRVKCLDCPGKIYSLGPGETMQNFDVHLKNKKHKENVAARQATEG